MNERADGKSASGRRNYRVRTGCKVPRRHSNELLLDQLKIHYEIRDVKDGSFAR